MNYSKSVVGALAALAVRAPMFGQSMDATASGSLLGQRYASIGVFVEDFRDVPVPNGVGPVLGVNLPLTAQVDLSLGYSYERAENSVIDVREHGVGASLIAHTAYAGVKPFASATLGYAWAKVTDPVRYSENDAFWGVGVGVEVPVASATNLTGQVSYGDGFDEQEGGWSFSVAANHWFTPRVFGQLSVSFIEDDSVVYGASTGLRF